MSEPFASPPRTLYLDASDLSYLVKGRGPRSAPDIGDTRQRLVDLMRAGRVRLCVSFVHLAEMALDEGTSAAALAWLDAGVPVWCFTTPAEAIFRAELRGEWLGAEAGPLTRADVEAQRIPLRGAAAAVPGRLGARAIKHVTAWWAAATNLSKRARQRRPDARAHEHKAARAQQARNVDAILRGDDAELPKHARWLARTYRPIATKALSCAGLTLADLRTHTRLPPGQSWMTSLLPPSEWKEASARIAKPACAPASAMRSAIETWEHTDAHRVARSALLYDVQHLAYAVLCDFATIDGPNFQATAKVRERIVTTAFFKTGRLREVVDAVGAP